MKKIIASFLSIFIVGCFLFGHPIDQMAVAKIKRGVTTKAQVIELLGNPDGVSKSNGLISFIYTHTTSEPGTNGPIGDIIYHTEKVTVKFDKNDIVTYITDKTSSSSIGVPDNDNLFEHRSVNINQ